jgi:CheY-like chemotaxis protein
VSSYIFVLGAFPPRKTRNRSKQKAVPRSLRVLAVVAGEDFYRALQRRLPTTGVETSRTTSVKSALLITRLVRYDLILAQCPRPDLDKAEFKAQIRESASASRDTPLLFLRQGPACETHGCDHVGTCYFLDTSERQLKRALIDLLGSANRLRDRLIVKATTTVNGGPVTRILQTRDLSSRGAFLVSNQKVELGAQIELSFELPGKVQPVRATAQVIRAGARSSLSRVCRRWPAAVGNLPQRS